MPDEIRDEFYKFASNDGEGPDPGIDCYIEFDMSPPDFWDGGGNEKYAKDNRISRERHEMIKAWLLSNGATPSDHEVIIKHWW